MACQPRSQLQVLADSFSELVVYINEANNTTDYVERVRMISAGAVGLAVRELPRTLSGRLGKAAAETRARGDPRGDAERQRPLLRRAGLDGALGRPGAPDRAQ